MVTKTSTRVSVDLLPDLHEELKEIAQTSGKSVKTYVTEALESCIQRDTEEKDRLWDELAEEALEEGLISIEESRDLMKRMKIA